MELIEYLEKLEIHENKKEWDELLKLSEEAVENFPYSQTLKIYKIRALIEKERLNEAKFLCEELIKTNPGSSIIHSLLADIYEKRGDFKRAIDEYNKILFLNPGDTKSISEIERLKKFLEENESSVEQESKEEVAEEGKDKFIVDEGKESIAEDNESKIVDDKKKEIKAIPEERVKEYEEILEEKDLAGPDEFVRKKIEDQSNFEDRSSKELLLSDDNKIKEENREGAEKREIPDEDLYTTVSMADILEKQGKYYEAQKIFYKLYKKDKSINALKGYKRTGLKFYESFLNKLNRRISRSV